MIAHLPARWGRCLGGVCLALVATTCLAAEPDRAAVDALLEKYVAGFNAHDAAAVAACWTEQGVHNDRQNDQRIEGRAAILTDLESLFAEQADLRLDTATNRVRFIRPDVAEVEGEATVTRPGQLPSTTRFVAILVRDESTWLIDRVDESATAAPESAQGALASLAWLVGTWVDDNQQVNVQTLVRWGAGETFLVRSYTVTRSEEDIRQGTQVIGWDPRVGQIRSWNFEADGAFGEAYWSRNGDEWLIRLNQTLADGRTASGTQIMRQLDDDTFRVQMIGLEIDGEPQPSREPVRVVRTTETATTSNEGNGK